MPTVIDMGKLHPNNFSGKLVEDSSLRTTLRQGVEYGTATAPNMALGRPAGSKPVISFSMALACAKLILKSEAGAARFLGVDGATIPSAISVKTKDKGFELLAALRKSADGLKGALELRGNQFGMGMFSYYAGIAVASWMLMNHNSYKNFADSVEKAIEAKDDPAKCDQALALMADELSFAVENMMNGTDPMGVTEINLDQIMPTDLVQEFKGGENIPPAFEMKDGLAKLRKTKARAVTAATAVMDDDTIDTDYIGDLPYELKDFFLRGWHVLMTGPTSTGKTKAINDVILHLKAPFERKKGSPGIEDRDLLGMFVRDTSGQMVPSYGPLARAVIAGKQQWELMQVEKELAKKEGRIPKKIPPSIFFADEINRFDERYQNVFIGLLDEAPDSDGLSYHELWVPETNETLRCPVGSLVFLAARNFGSGYVGTNDMDQALVRRFHVKLDMEYLEASEEKKIVTKRTGLDEKTVKVLVKAATDTRTHQRAQLKAPIDTDTILKWAYQLAYLKDKGVQITDKIVLDVAKKIVFEVCVDRTETGQYDPAGETIVTDNINESWKEVMRK